MNLNKIRALFRKRFHLPKERPIKRTIAVFTLAERSTFYFFVALFTLSGLFLAWQVSAAYLVNVPTYGGSLTEGVVGNPRFINPVLALSEADKNLTTLVYSGLVRVDASGKIENDLASSVSISEDGLTYTIKINPASRFHDGEKITAEDVAFTIGKILDPLIKSPRRGNWDGVTTAVLDEETLTFTLKKSYSPFIYNLTLGILPKHIWKNVTADEFSFSQFNTLPIGSGPYQIEKVERNQGGIPDYYQMKPFENLGKEAFIKNLTLRFYSSEDELVEAYLNGDIESVAGLSAEKLADLEVKDAHILRSPLPRIFAAFINQSRNKALLDKSVRQALNLSAPRLDIIREVFDGFATPITTPLPAGLYSWTSTSISAEGEAKARASAAELLANAGWKKNPQTGVLEKTVGKDTISLSFSISTGDAPELRKVAEKLAASWGELGAEVKILAFETGELNQSVIRPRNFDVLLFGELVGKDADLYPFWHSSQRNDPGLNIALYANAKADKLLESARSATDTQTVEERYKELVAEIESDIPAIFLYTPSFIYLVPERIQNVEIGPLLSSADRFANVRAWYIETDKVWKIFLD